MGNDTREKVSLNTVLKTFGWSDELYFIVVGCLIWGFFPLLVTEDTIGKLATEFPYVYFISRYIPAIIFFLLMQIIMILYYNSKLKNIIDFFKKYWLNLFFMGFLLFVARLCEIKAYINKTFINFAIIYCIFFVIFWDAKGWIGTLISKIININIDRDERKNQSIFYKSLLSSIFAPIPEPVKFILWFIQVILVIVSGFFLIYFQDGVLAFSVRPMLWCLLSALFVSFFFDQMVWIREEEKPDGTEKNLDLVCKSQLGAAMSFSMVTLCFLIISIINDTKQPDRIIELIQKWDGLSYWNLIIGLGVLGTFVAYLFEGLGAAKHDDSQEKYGNWKINGREWLSIMANLDPVFAAIVMIGMKHEASGWWIIIPIFSIAAIAGTTFVKLWSKKASEIRRETFTHELELKQNALKENNLNILKEKTENMTYLLHYESEYSEIEAKIMLNQSKFLCISSNSENNTDKDIPEFLKDFLKDAERFYSQLSDLPKSTNPECVMFFIKNGNKWFDRYNLECNAVFEAHKDYLLFETGNRILRIEDMISFMNSSKNRHNDFDSVYNQAGLEKELREFLFKNKYINNIKEFDHILPLVFYNNGGDSEPEISASKWIILADLDKLSAWYEISQSHEKEIEKRLTDELIRFENLKNLSKIVFYTKDKGIPVTDPDGDAEWVLLHDVILNNISENPSIIPDWLIKKRVVFFYHEWFLPQTWRMLGFGNETCVPSIDLSPYSDTDNEYFKKAGEMAEKRYRISPHVYVIDDDNDRRRDTSHDIKPSLIGTNGELFTPEHPKEAIDFLEKDTKIPLVFLDHDFSKSEEWSMYQNGNDFIKPYYTRIDSYLVTTRGAYFPDDRKCSTDKYDIVSKVAKHCGVRGKYGEYTPWSTLFKRVESLLTQWNEIITYLSNKKRTADANLYCHSLFISHAEQKRK